MLLEKKHEPELVFINHSSHYSVFIKNLELLSALQLKDLFLFVKKRNSRFNFKNSSFEVYRKITFDNFLMLLDMSNIKIKCNEVVLKDGFNKLGYNASVIINSMKERPLFLKLSKHSCIKKIESALFPSLQEMIKFSYIRDETLFFVLTHSSDKQKFEKNLKNLRSILKNIRLDECENIKISDIKAFVSNEPLGEVSLFDAETKEEVSSNFEIKMKDMALESLPKSTNTWDVTEWNFLKEGSCVKI